MKMAEVCYYENFHQCINIIVLIVVPVCHILLNLIKNFLYAVELRVIT